MTTTELILYQVKFLRDCHKDSKLSAIEYAEAKSAWSGADSIVGMAIKTGRIERDGVEIKLPNEDARKAFKQQECEKEIVALNLAKEMRDVAAKKVLVEISVLSALKQIARDEDIDDSLLAQYDILGEEENE